MPMTKQEAYKQASDRASSAATVASIIADADKILNYVNGTTGASCASAAPKPATGRRVPAIRYVAEYRNKNGVDPKDNTNTHLGKKLFQTYSGAAKMAKGKGTLGSRFIKVVKLVEAV